MEILLALLVSAGALVYGLATGRLPGSRGEPRGSRVPVQFDVERLLSLAGELERRRQGGRLYRELDPALRREYADLLGFSALFSRICIRRRRDAWFGAPRADSYALTADGRFALIDRDAEELWVMRRAVALGRALNLPVEDQR